MVSTEIPEYGLLTIRERLKRLVDQLQKFQKAYREPLGDLPHVAFWKNQFWDLEREARALTDTLLMWSVLQPTWPEVEVLEMDQWSATAKNLDELNFADFRTLEGPKKLVGGDAKAAQAIFGGHYLFKKVSTAPDVQPSIGRVWFQEDPETQKLVLWKGTYDSSG